MGALLKHQRATKSSNPKLSKWNGKKGGHVAESSWEYISAKKSSVNPQTLGHENYSSN